MALSLAFHPRGSLLTVSAVCFAAALAFPGLLSMAMGSEPALRYSRDVMPILAENCFSCHGQDEKTRQSGLRLDVREEALRGGDSGQPTFVPGEPDKSELIARITSSDANLKMPPADSGKTLTTEQVATLRRWIGEQAPYEGHWSFTAPVRPEPANANGTTPLSPIDQLIEARLARENLVPNEEASASSLIRRLSIDLTGLPPTSDEVDAFVSSYQAAGADQVSGDKAYAETVERLLASPHFGEKWARLWLDAARYADTDGYEKDLPRQQWLWRDWVIQAFDEDKPYNEFLIEQIAGDMLPNATQQQKIATGFFRNGMVNEEGAIVYEQFRVEGLVDRIDCIGKSVLGLTLQCAQCHSHKFDPITQDEYYGLFAMLNNTFEQTMWVYNDEQLERIKQIDLDHIKLRDELKLKIPPWRELLADWESRVARCAPQWKTLDPKEYEWIGGVAHPVRLPDHSVITLGFRPTDGDVYMVSDLGAGERPTGVRLEALTHGDFPFGGPGRNHEGTFAVSELVVEMKPTDSAGPWTPVKLVNATADFSNPAGPIPEFFRKGNDDKRTIGPAPFLIDGDESTAWMADRGAGLRHQDTDWVAQFAPDTAWPDKPYSLKFTFKYRHGGSDIHGRASLYLARFRLSVTESSAPSANMLSAAAERALATPESERTGEQRTAIFDSWRAHPSAVVAVGDDTSRAAMQALEENRVALVALWNTYPIGNTVLNLAERDGPWVRDTFVLERGAWDHPGKKINPGVPSFLHPLPAGASANRLGLAQWLADERSPTTARSYVNRIWQALFGQGLVESPEDFGVRAKLPEQADVLDWLAVEFMHPSTSPTSAAGNVPEKAWSTKHLLRCLVMSKAYRRDSKATDELMRRDPNNRLLARGPRFRMDGEAVRDAALHIAGLLEAKKGGPSFFPPVPNSLFETNYLKIDWQAAPAPERYRRSLYMFRRRSMPDPVLSNFDAPSGEFACVRRVRSNTPLAALTSLNEPVFFEAARALALRVLKEGGETDQQRAAHAFKLCTSRAPTQAETAVLLHLLETRTQRIAQGWVSAPELALGETKNLALLPPNVTPTQAAAWTVVSRVLLNLDETLSKN